MKRLASTATTVILVGAAMLTGFLGYRHFVGDDTAAGAPRQLPDLTLPDLRGMPRALSEWKGRPLLINFWATWCGPCREEIPLLKKLRAQYAAQGLEVVGIAIDSPDAVAAYSKQIGIPYPILVAQDGSTWEAFGTGTSLPTTLFVDREGRIRTTKVGELQNMSAKRLLKPLLEVR